jgi:hypothetical protein
MEGSNDCGESSINRSDAYGRRRPAQPKVRKSTARVSAGLALGRGLVRIAGSLSEGFVGEVA